MKLCFFVWFLFLILSGCAKQNSSAVNQSGIYTSYILNYDDNEQTLSAFSSFNFGGSTGTYLNLDGTSSVEFDGDAMGQDITIFNQVIYQWRKSSLTSDSIWKPHTFKYRNNDGNIYSNSATPPFLPTATYSPTTILTGQSLGVHWSISDSLNKGSINVLLTDGQTNVLSSVSSTQASSGNIIISPTEMLKLAKGTITAHVCRSEFSTPTQKPEQGGLLQTSSCTKNQTLQLN